MICEWATDLHTLLLAQTPTDIWAHEYRAGERLQS